MNIKVSKKTSKWRLERKKLPLAFEWKITRGSSFEKENLFLELHKNNQIFKAEVAPNKRYGESVKKIINEWERARENNDIENLEKISHFPSLKSAIQYCRLCFEASENGQYLHSYVKTKPLHKLQSFFSIPLMKPHKLARYLEDYGKGFSFFKMKASGPESLELIEAFYQLRPTTPIIIDGNEGFHKASEVLELLEKLKNWPILYMEQPLAAGNDKEQRKLFQSINIPVFADESCVNETKIDDLLGLFHGINIKLMKSMPLVAIRQLQRAKELGLKTMVGCMVETSLGISQVMNLGLQADYYDLDGWLFFKDEPFGLLKNKGGVFYLT